MRRALDRHGDPRFCLRQAGVLAFFSTRVPAARVLLDTRLHEDGLATPEGVVLGPGVFNQEREAAVLSHELFHLWCRSAVDAGDYGGLTCLTPAALHDGSVEEIATDLLARGLCDHLGVPFSATYLPRALAPELFEVRLGAARAAVAEARRSAAAVSATAEAGVNATARDRKQAAAAPRAATDVAALEKARAALRLLSGFELAATALLEVGLEPEDPRPRWPAPLGREVTEVRDLVTSFLPELAGPQLLRGLCKLFARRGWNDHRRGPLWSGDSPLELPGRLLSQRTRQRDPAHLAAVAAFLEGVEVRLTGI